MRKLVLVLAVGALSTGALASTAAANHSWGKYHWARTANPFTLKTGDNVSSAWDTYLNEAISDWNPSAVLDLTKVAGGTTGSTCTPTSGRIEACNANYGATGWLGVAQIWIARGGRHITQATTKVNDHYFDQAQYNTPAWRRLVMCQEIAHDFGLDHQDENFNNVNLGSCMDYTNDPDGGAGGAASNDPSNEHPNQHDFNQLQSIYSHLDGTTTVGQAASPSAAPTRVERTDRISDSTIVDHYGDGSRLVTHVIWAIGTPDDHVHHGHAHDHVHDHGH